MNLKKIENYFILIKTNNNIYLNIIMDIMTETHNFPILIYFYIFVLFLWIFNIIWSLFDT